MDDLIKQITAKTGISDQQAHEAVQMVVNYVKQQLPAPLAGEVDSLLAGKSGNDVMQQAVGDLGGMLGKK